MDLQYPLELIGTFVFAIFGELEVRAKYPDMTCLGQDLLVL